jgi:Do/DeqQ family serine protease
MKTILQLTAAVLISTTLSLFLFLFIETSPKEVITKATPPALPTTYAYNLNGLKETPSNFVEAANKSIDAVVHVKNTALSNERFSPLEYFYGKGENRERIGTGSGVIVSPDGFIITNNHVIEDATKIEVTTNDNVRYDAELIGTDPYTDIAVLKIKSQDKLPYLFFGNSDTTQIGEWVLAIGNPFNLNSTVTAGIISAKARDLNSRDDKNQSFLQTDAAVNRGNSGGALVNTQGELIGINTAITTFSGGFEGYSFAVPSNIARKVFEDLIEYGSTQKGLLGVQGNAISPEFKERFDELNISVNEGFYVGSVIPGMGAAKAGIQERDVILSVDQVKIKQFSDLTGYLESKRPDDVVDVVLFRNGKEKKLKVTLAKSMATQFMGMNLRNLTPEDQSAFGIEKGIIVDAAGPYFLNQIEAGSLITGINGNHIYNIDDLQAYDIRSVEWISYITPDGEQIRLRL